MNCADCGNWLLERKTVYSDGSEIHTFKSPEGKGRCLVLSMDTAPDFGCNKFVPGAHCEIEHKPDVPWHYWVMIPCPACGNADARGTKCQCAGTGKVRLYDDGYIGDERTRRHPKDSPTYVPSEPDPGTILRAAEKASVIDQKDVL